MDNVGALSESLWKKNIEGIVSVGRNLPTRRNHLFESHLFDDDDDI
jgi:hypothetical protein